MGRRRHGIGRAAARVLRLAALATVIPLWCAILVGLALPLVRMIHEDTHHHHGAERALTPPLAQLSAADGDDDEGSCALCQLLAVSSGLQAVVQEHAPILLPSVCASLPSPPPSASPWIGSARHQPPARGPPAVTLA